MENQDIQTKQECKMLQLWKPAPQFTAKTSHWEKSLSDYEGKWLILFSHPADFTPVCTTEFMAFSWIYDELQKRNTELLWLSIDSVFSHIAWTRNIKEKTWVEIQFPIIEDLSMNVSKKYWMIHEWMWETQAVRAVFFIDPNWILRSMIYYPMSLWRNFDEILRVIDALQTADENQCATPANWRPWDKVIVPPADTTEKAEENFNNSSYEVTDWYLCKKDAK